MFKMHTFSTGHYFGTTRHAHIRDAVADYTAHGWHITRFLRDARQLEIVVTRNDLDISRTLVFRVAA